MARRILPAALALLLAPLAPLVAQEQTVPEPELETRLINLPTHITLGAGTMQVLFTHRFADSIQGAGSTNLYGLDTAADVGIGFGIGLARNLDVEIYRSSFFKEIETAFKWTPFRQGDAFPFGVAVRVGGDYRGAQGVTNRWAGIAQLVIARRLGTSLDLFAVPSYASDTPGLRRAANVAVGASYHLAHAWDLSAEAIPANRDTPDSHIAWAVAASKRLRGHGFLFYFGNSRATTTDMITGSDYPGGFKVGDVRLGFNLIRRFPE